MCDHTNDIERFEALGKLVVQLNTMIDEDGVETVSVFKDRVERVKTLGEAFIADYNEYLGRIKKSPGMACGQVYTIIQQIDMLIIGISFKLRMAAESIQDTEGLLSAVGIDSKKKEHFIN